MCGHYLYKCDFLNHVLVLICWLQGTARRKKKVVHRTATTDDKKLQSSLKKLSVSNIPGIEEVNRVEQWTPTPCRSYFKSVLVVACLDLKRSSQELCFYPASIMCWQYHHYFHWTTKMRYPYHWCLIEITTGSQFTTKCVTIFSMPLCPDSHDVLLSGSLNSHKDLIPLSPLNAH